MIYALDTEFIEDGSTIELISIGLVAEDGRECYIQNRNAQLHKAHPWVKEYVLPHLNHANCLVQQKLIDMESDKPHCGKADCPWMRHRDMGACLKGFTSYDRKPPTFIGYYSAYDWVALCQLFGTMMDLPKGWPMYCLDLRQMLDERGMHHITQPDDMPHHALSDARWIMQTYRQCICMDSALVKAELRK